MAKEDKEAEGDQAEEEKGAEGEVAAAKQGFVKKLLGNKKMLLIVGIVLLLLLGGGGAGLYFFVLSGNGDSGQAGQAAPIAPPQVAYFDLPDLLVNIQTADGATAYLKMSLSLELNSEEDKTGMQALTPRINDQLQGYLRELRTDDLKGSAGVMRLKEELLRRVNVAAAPYRVRDVLLKEMMVQ
jgi:flagellar protein FliL